VRPAPRGAVLFAGGVLLALLPAVGWPRAWPLLLAFWGCATIAFAADALLSPRRRDVAWEVRPPDTLHVGEKESLVVSLALGSGRPVPAETVVDASDEISPPDPVSVTLGPGPSQARFALSPRRRGTARLEALWIRYRSPLGLWCWTIRREMDARIPILPNLTPLRATALRFFADRHFRAGLKIERYQGDGTEFESLKESIVGDDPRAIDWKASARHRKLLGRQFRAERNHQIILAVDTGRLMCEALGGVSKLDHALGAALHLAYVGLRSGDRVGLFTFAGRVGLALDPVAGISSMGSLIRLSSQIEYSGEETNFTLALTTLAQRLRRRSLVVLLTDFVDTVTAELMIENLGRLSVRHLIVFISIRDPLLAALQRIPPSGLEELNRAVVAHDLLQDRETVQRRLRRMGIHPLDAEPGRIGPELINRYLDIKRRELV
jgi:uncharacterized protein (DUF58 family)